MAQWNLKIKLPKEKTAVAWTQWKTVQAKQRQRTEAQLPRDHSHLALSCDILLSAPNRNVPEPHEYFRRPPWVQIPGWARRLLADIQPTCCPSVCTAHQCQKVSPSTGHDTAVRPGETAESARCSLWVHITGTYIKRPARWYTPAIPALGRQGQGIPGACWPG